MPNSRSWASRATSTTTWSEVLDAPEGPDARDNRGLRSERGGNHRDILKGIPDFSMHIVCSTLGDYILEQTDLPRGTASLMIANEIPGDHRSDLDRVGDTGKLWYSQAQRISEKLKAMELLLNAFHHAGGLYPQ